MGLFLHSYTHTVWDYVLRNAPLGNSVIMLMSRSLQTVMAVIQLGDQMAQDCCHVCGFSMTDVRLRSSQLLSHTDIVR